MEVAGAQFSADVFFCMPGSVRVFIGICASLFYISQGEMMSFYPSVRPSIHPLVRLVWFFPFVLRFLSVPRPCGWLFT